MTDAESPATAPKGQAKTPGGPSGRPPMSGFKKGALALIFVVLAASVGARAFLGSTQQEPPAAAMGIMSADGGAQSEPTALEQYLPYVTEGSFFALIGFALGYASRKIVKLGLIVIALFFVALQVLSYKGIATMDWGRAIEVINDLVLNLEENETFTEVLKDKLPSTGAFLAGYLLGFRRG